MQPTATSQDTDASEVQCLILRMQAHSASYSKMLVSIKKNNKTTKKNPFDLLSMLDRQFPTCPSKSFRFSSYPARTCSTL